MEVIGCGLEFLAAMVLLCRVEVLLDLVKSVLFYMKYTGKGLTALERASQYSAFVKNIFLAPAAGINTTSMDHVSWQLHPAEGICAMGVCIFLICIASTVLNWKKTSTRLAAFWVAFSVFMLFVLGWGTKENGLILYSLYFGWAFLTLLFQFVERLEAVLPIKLLTPILNCSLVVIMLTANIPAILKLMGYAATYYPI